MILQGPSSLEGGQPPEIFWTESSQHDSTSQGYEVTEESSRPEGKRGGEETSSLDQAEWSCADSASTFTLRDAHRIAAWYDMTMAIPQEMRRMHKPLTGHVMASEVFLMFGVRFPLHLCFRNILNFYNLTVFQVTPNGWVHMIGLFFLFAKRKMDPPSLEEFSWFYTLKSNKGDLGFYYFPK